MEQENYLQVENTDDFEAFMFVSEGRHGNLFKVVSFDEINPDMFNLSLGTILRDNEIDFITITNNGDRNRILATVARIIEMFLEKHPGKSVYLAGGDERRNLLYQRAIKYGYDYFIEKFQIYGDVSKYHPATKFEDFSKQKNYRGFLIKRK